MNSEDQKRALLALANQFAGGEALNEAQRDYMAIVLYRIATGEDANKVLEVHGKRGKKLSDVIARRRLSMILHWIACAMSHDPSSTEKALTLSEACIEAMEAIVPLAKASFPGADHHEYDAQYLERCWREPDYEHMRSTTRSWFDPDFPYFPLLSKTDPK
jgi:hypothetical protein